MSDKLSASYWASPPVYESSSSSSTTLKPYLQLPHLLSLTWLAYPILSLLFVAFRLQLSSSASQDAVSSAKGDLLTSCKAAEQAATAAASMPRYMAIATNQQFADAVNGTMNGARAALILALTVMETIINFIVDIYRSTFLCFLELVVRGGLAILISAVQEINNFVQSTMSSIRTSIQNDVTTANSAIQSAVSAVNKINPFGNISVPQFNIPSLTALQNVTLPTDFENALVTLNNSLPSVSDLKDKIDAIIDTPFEAVKKDINDTFVGLSFDPSVLPVPQQNTLSFCNEMDTSVVDDLGRDLIKVAKIGTLIIILVALLLLAGNCALEWYKWRCLKRHLEYTRQAWQSDPTVYHSGPEASPSVTLSDHNLLMLQANSSHPLLTRIANTLAARFRLTQSQHIHLQWFFHYVFHPPALACFLIGFFGLLSVQLQLLAVGPLAAKYSNRAASSVSDFSNTIATSVNNSMYNQSASYANDINGRVDAIQSSINNGLFGWVNGTTTTLNDTLNAFYDDIQNTVSTVFNGTILESPAQEFIRCFIGSKVDALEEALTFLHDNLQVNMPRLNDSILVLSPAEVNEATQPIAAAAIGGGNGDNEGLIGRLVATYVESLKKEQIMFAIFMGLWGFVVLMALCIIFWHSYGRRWREAYKKRKWKKEQRSGFGDIVVPFRDHKNVSGEKHDGSGTLDLPSFTPLPSPRRGLFPFNHSDSGTAPDPNRLQAIHPLNALDPKFGRSWDSFLDHNASSQARQSLAAKSISGPRKFIARAFGKEGSGADEEKADGNSGDAGWRTRFRDALRRKGLSKDNAEPSSPRIRSRPNLTITTPSLDGDRTVIEDSENAARPSSAWSVSPTPPKTLPWINLISTTKFSPGPPGLPLRPKPRRNVSVPSDVGSTYGDSTLLLPRPIEPTPIAIPIHHGFEHRASPIPVTEQFQNRLAPNRHRRTSSVPAAALAADKLTPQTRLLTTMHARRSSATLNPFVTPFDDEARVTTNTKGRGVLTAIAY